MSEKRELWMHCGMVSLALSAVLAVLPVAVAAQTVVDARTAEFTPSPDHDQLAPGGGQMVTSYQLQIFTASGGTLIQSVSLGKPAPQLDGFIRLDFVSLLTTPLTPGIEYRARVAAIGPGGTGLSELSNSFTYSLTCSPTLSASSGSVPPGGGTGTVGVTVAGGCAWTAVSHAGWITVTSGTAGTGNGTVGFTAAANTTSTSRTGTLTIAGQTFAVTQGASSCTYSISPTSRSVDAAAQTTFASVSAGSGCPWTATSNAGWLTITSGASGTGAGTVAIGVGANTSTSARAGTVTIAGQTLTVSQAAACTYLVTPPAVAAPAGGLSGTLSVTTTTTCTWGVTGTVPSWLTIPTAARTGTGTLDFAVAPNTGTTARSVTLTVAGQTVTISQPAAITAPPPAPTGLRVVTGGD